jgi:microcystin-dependent protein
MEPFLGQISIVAFPFAPRGWALCNGQVLAIVQNQALFSLLGTTYGGNGINTFALPNLQGRAAMHTGNVNALGTLGGAEAVPLNVQQIPLHTHSVRAVKAVGNVATPSGSVWAASTGNDLQYATGTMDVVMAPTVSGPGGSDQPHNNMPPVTVLNFVIALQGIFPSRN